MDRRNCHHLVQVRSTLVSAFDARFWWYPEQVEMGVKLATRSGISLLLTSPRVRDVAH